MLEDPLQQQRASLSALPAAIDLPPHPAVVDQPARNHRRQRQTRYVTDDFTIRRTLGTGSFGRVHLGSSIVHPYPPLY